MIERPNINKKRMAIHEKPKRYWRRNGISRVFMGAFNLTQGNYRFRFIKKLRISKSILPEEHS